MSRAQISEFAKEAGRVPFTVSQRMLPSKAAITTKIAIGLSATLKMQDQKGNQASQSDQYSQSSDTRSMPNEPYLFDWVGRSFNSLVSTSSSNGLLSLLKNEEHKRHLSAIFERLNALTINGIDDVFSVFYLSLRLTSILPLAKRDWKAHAAYHQVDSDERFQCEQYHYKKRIQCGSELKDVIIEDLKEQIEVLRTSVSQEREKNNKLFSQVQKLSKQRFYSESTETPTMFSKTPKDCTERYFQVDEDLSEIDHQRPQVLVGLG